MNEDLWSSVFGQNHSSVQLWYTSRLRRGGGEDRKVDRHLSEEILCIVTRVLTAGAG